MNKLIAQLQKFNKYKYLMAELVVRDIKLKYRRSALGYLWSLLNPLLTMIVVSAVFSFIFKQDIVNFPIYLLIGQILFQFFSESTNMAMGSIIQNGPLIKKVYIPMDDDDSYPERFEKQLGFLKEHLDYGFVGCNVDLVQDGINSGKWIFSERPQVRDFLFSMPFVHPALLFRRESLEAVGGYSTLACCERCEDYDLLLRLYEHRFCGANMQEVLFVYSLPHNGISTRNFKDRVNESKMRFVRFLKLNLLPEVFLCNQTNGCRNNPSTFVEAS